LPLFKSEPDKQKLEWIRLSIYPTRGDHHVGDLYPKVGTGGSKPSCQEGKVFHNRRKIKQFQKRNHVEKRIFQIDTNP
jgi:hypothetical protein